MISEMISNLSSVVEPGVHSVTGRAEVRLSKLIFLGPAQWCVTQTLLNDCVEPSQQEVETSALVGSLWKHETKRVIKNANVEGVCRHHG